MPKRVLANPVRRAVAWLFFSYGVMFAALLSDFYSHAGSTEVIPTQLVEFMRTVILISWLSTAWFLVAASRSRPAEPREKRQLGYATFFWFALPFCFMGIISLSMMLDGIRSADYLERR
ncbi:MAG: hypothetical protein K1X67_02775 [Fimbriimonadaceae bacterium]|nr:hypothetical protein [Fimbriimonadaceae bacterium]